MEIIHQISIQGKNNVSQKLQDNYNEVTEDMQFESAG